MTSAKKIRDGLYYWYYHREDLSVRRRRSNSHKVTTSFLRRFRRSSSSVSSSPAVNSSSAVQSSGEGLCVAMRSSVGQKQQKHQFPNSSSSASSSCWTPAEAEKEVEFLCHFLTEFLVGHSTLSDDVTRPPQLIVRRVFFFWTGRHRPSRRCQSNSKESRVCLCCCCCWVFFTDGRCAVHSPPIHCPSKKGKTKSVSFFFFFFGWDFASDLFWGGGEVMRRQSE